LVTLFAGPAPVATRFKAGNLFRPVDEKQQANEGTENSTNTSNANYQPDQNCADGCDHLDLTSIGFWQFACHALLWVRMSFFV